MVKAVPDILARIVDQKKAEQTQAEDEVAERTETDANGEDRALAS